MSSLAAMHLVRRAASRALTSTKAARLAVVVGRSSPAAFVPALAAEPWAAPFASAVRRGFSSESESRSDGAAADGGEARPSASSDRLYAAAGAQDANGSFSRGRPDFAPRAANAWKQAISPSNVVYVGNIQFEVPEQDIKQEFARFGNVVSAQLATDSMGRSKGFAYVQFDSVQEADEAIKAMDGAVYRGRQIVVGYRIKSNAQPSFRNKPPTRTVYVGNLSYEMTDVDLNKLFRDIPDVLEVRVSVDRRTGQPRGFAHVDFRDVDGAKKCVDLLDGRVVLGRRLRIDFAESRRSPLPTDLDNVNNDNKPSPDTPAADAPAQ